MKEAWHAGKYELRRKRIWTWTCIEFSFKGGLESAKKPVEEWKLAEKVLEKSEESAGILSWVRAVQGIKLGED